MNIDQAKTNMINTNQVYDVVYVVNKISNSSIFFVSFGEKIY